MARREFQKPAELGAWLAGAGIDTATWGEGEAKALDDLWGEYLKGESSFDDEPPSRVIKVVQLVIRRGDAILTEIDQLFADGRRRTRMRPPSEKLARGEEPRAAVLRCLSEELGLRAADVVIEREREPYEVISDSPSYPGLPTRYFFHTFEVAAENLPDEDFYRDNSAAGDPVRRHQWGWRRE